MSVSCNFTLLNCLQINRRMSIFNLECRLSFGMLKNEELSQLDIKILNPLYCPLHGFLVYGNVVIDLIVHVILMLGCAQRECLFHSNKFEIF